MNPQPVNQMELESKVAGKNLEGAEADPIQYAYIDPESVVYLESISSIYTPLLFVYPLKWP